MKKRVLYYKGRGHEDAERLQIILETTVHNCRLDIHETVESMSRRVRQMGNGVAIAVLFVATGDELIDILAVSDLLHDTHTILILPDGDKETVVKAMKLRPHFLSYVHGDFMDVDEVLRYWKKCSLI